MRHESTTRRGVGPALALATLALLLPALVSTPAARAGNGAELAGTWQANVGGQQLTLVLAADGTGTLNGQPGRWRSDGKSVVLADAQGNELAGQLVGGELVFTAEGQTIRFTRAAPAQEAKPLPKWKPGKLLKGKKHKPGGSDLSFTLPSGWVAEWTELDGEEVYAIAPAKQKGKGAVLLALRLLEPSEKQVAPDQLLAGYGGQLGRSLKATTVEPAAAYAHGGHVVVTMALEAGTGDDAVEVYLAARFLGDWALVAVGLYPSKLAKSFRPGAVTALATLAGTPPKPDAGKERLVGCWEEYISSSSPGGGSSSAKVKLGADGRYTWRSYVSVGGVFSESNEAGAWRVETGKVVMTPDGGAAATYSFSFKGYALHMGGRRWIPCS